MGQSAFKIGDCVVLKHGGANIKMTIDMLFTYHGTERATCKWYNSKESKFEDVAVSLDALDLCDAR